MLFYQSIVLWIFRKFCHSLILFIFQPIYAFETMFLTKYFFLWFVHMNYYPCFFYQFLLWKFASFLVSKVFSNTFSRRSLANFYLEIFLLYCSFRFLIYLYTILNSFLTYNAQKISICFFLNLSTCVVFNTFASIGTCWGIISSSLSTFVVWSAKEFKSGINIWGSEVNFPI